MNFFFVLELNCFSALYVVLRFFVALVVLCFRSLQSKLDLLTDTLVSGQLYLRPPCLKPRFNFHTNSVFLNSRKRTFPLPVADTFREYDLDFFFVLKLP